MEIHLIFVLLNQIGYNLTNGGIMKKRDLIIFFEEKIIDKISLNELLKLVDKSFEKNRFDNFFIKGIRYLGYLFIILSLIFIIKNFI